MRRIIGLVASLATSLFGPVAYAQTLTYSVEGNLTTVPSCVSTVFSVGDPWKIDITVDLSPPEEDDSVTDAETAPENDGSPSETETAPVIEFILTKHYPARAFSWTVGSLSGTATGVTRVFVSDDHLAQDSIAWQALDYSATFEPSALGETEIRGIQAGLIDTSGSVFSSTDLPEEVGLPQFDSGGFFQAFFQTKCGVFRNNPITGSVSTLIVAVTAQSDIAGRWDLTFTSDQGTNSSIMTLQQDEEKVTGSLATDEGTLVIKGTVSGNELELFMDFDQAVGTTGELSVVGAVDGNQLTCTFDQRGGTAGALAGDCAATRIQ